jgi:hypothetical protein
MIDNDFREFPWFGCALKPSCNSHGHGIPHVLSACASMTHLDPPLCSPTKTIRMIKHKIKLLGLAFNLAHMVSKDLHTINEFIWHQLGSGRMWDNMAMTTLHGKSMLIQLNETLYRTPLHLMWINFEDTHYHIPIHILLYHNILLLIK